MPETGSAAATRNASSDSSFGFFDKNGKLATDSPEAIAGAEMYKRLLRESGPAGVAEFNWNECQSLFLQSKAAMWIDGIGFAPPLEDSSNRASSGRPAMD